MFINIQRHGFDSTYRFGVAAQRIPPYFSMQIYRGRESPKVFALLE